MPGKLAPALWAMLAASPPPCGSSEAGPKLPSRQPSRLVCAPAWPNPIHHLAEVPLCSRRSGGLATGGRLGPHPEDPAQQGDVIDGGLFCGTFGALSRRMVRDMREARGLSQRQLAERMGTTQSVVGRLESGGSRPTLVTLERVADALGSLPRGSQRAERASRADSARCCSGAARATEQLGSTWVSLSASVALNEAELAGIRVEVVWTCRRIRE